MTVDVGEKAASSAPPPSSSSSAANTPRPPPPRWNTWEFRFYYLVLALALPLMVWVPVDLSRREGNENYYRFSSHLVRGWLFGRMRVSERGVDGSERRYSTRTDIYSHTHLPPFPHVFTALSSPAARQDNSDFQYRSFRDYIPALTAIATAYVLLSRLAAASRVLTRTQFLHVFTAIFVLALHGANTLKLGAALLLNYHLACAVAGRAYVAPLAIWAFNVGTLAVVHWNDGFQWQRIGGDALGWLDSYNGLLPRWQINYNITMLRMVSFGLDLHWQRLAARGKGKQREDGDYAAATASHRTRCSRPHPHSEYNLSNYLAYVLYPPLFIAGPIMTFNDFTAQLAHPLTIHRRAVASYAARFVFSLLTMEFILHFMYVNAIKDAHAWKGQTPLQLSMVGFWNLIIVWLKLLLPWRFFRLWALADGVDPPENMIRCMANNYSTLGFWRSWHRSYNLWVVR